MNFLIKISYGYDGSSLQTITSENGTDIEFSGNSDRNSKVVNMFSVAIMARYIRLQPLDWYYHIAMRWDVLGG